MEIINGLIELIKLAPRYLFSLGVAAGFLLWADKDVLEHLGVQDFVFNNKFFLGLTFVLTSALFAVDLLVQGFNKARIIWLQRGYRRSIVVRLNTLTEDEKQILRFYIANNTRANSLKIDDGVVQGLANAQIIYRSASMGDLLRGWAFNISDFAWEYLNKNPHLLNGITNTYRNDRDSYSWDRI